MSDEYCKDDNCPACDLKRHMQHILDAGCPPEDLVEMTIVSLTGVVKDSLDIGIIELPKQKGTMH